MRMVNPTRFQLLGHDGHRIQIRGLALVGRHARGRVAFDVFDGVKAFAGREIKIARGDIMLPIDEAFLTR